MIAKNFLDEIDNTYFKAQVGFYLKQKEGIDLIDIQFAVAVGEEYKGYPTYIVNVFVDYEFEGAYFQSDIKIPVMHIDIGSFRNYVMAETLTELWWRVYMNKSDDEFLDETNKDVLE